MTALSGHWQPQLDAGCHGRDCRLDGAMSTGIDVKGRSLSLSVGAESNGRRSIGFDLTSIGVTLCCALDPFVRVCACVCVTQRALRARLCVCAARWTRARPGRVLGGAGRERVCESDRATGRGRDPDRRRRRPGPHRRLSSHAKSRSQITSTVLSRVRRRRGPSSSRSGSTSPR